jgi:hypothetical protein
MTSAEALWWVPSAAALVMTVLALLAALAQPTGPARTGWILTVLVCGTLAVAASAWQQADNRTALARETERLRELWARLDELGRALPAGPGSTPAETFDTIGAAIRSLNTRVEQLDDQLRLKDQEVRARKIDPQTAAQVAQHLRQYGRQRVVISCVPDDVESFAYANQIAAMLREAGWDALGPERTTIFGEAPSMAVRLFVRNTSAPPEAARVLVDAFARYNIPYQSGITPSDAIPDPATLELFVSRKS